MRLIYKLFHADGFDQDVSQDDYALDVVEDVAENFISLATSTAPIQQSDS